MEATTRRTALLITTAMVTTMAANHSGWLRLKRVSVKSSSNQHRSAARANHAKRATCVARDNLSAKKIRLSRGIRLNLNLSAQDSATSSQRGGNSLRPRGSGHRRKLTPTKTAASAGLSSGPSSLRSLIRFVGEAGPLQAINMTDCSHPLFRRQLYQRTQTDGQTNMRCSTFQFLISQGVLSTQP